MIGEIVAKTAEVVAEASKEIAKEESKETVRKAVDITQRVDTTIKDNSITNKGIDITKRLDIPDSDKNMLEPEKNSANIKNRLENASSKEVKPRELTDKERHLLTDKGFSFGILDNCTKLGDVYKLKTGSEKFEGLTQKESDIPYKRKIVDLHGIKIEGVFPEFESMFTAQLPMDKLTATDTAQFSECNSQLKKAIQADSSLASKFTPRQLEQIEFGKTPGCYTWHHNENVGKMELVDSEKHNIAKHTGGRAIWGGGSIARK